MMTKSAQFLIVICCAATALAVLAQDAVRPSDTHYKPVPKEQTPAPLPPQVAGTVRVDFPGATAFALADLKTAIAEQIKEIEDKGLTKARADDAAFFLAEYYRAHGYARAEAVWQIADAHHLVLKVSEGPVTTLRRIAFSGNRQIPDATLTDYLLGPTKERFPDLQDNFPYVEGDIQTGLEKVRGLYAAQGFLKATVLMPELGTPPASSLSSSRSPRTASRIPAIGVVAAPLTAAIGALIEAAGGPDEFLERYAVVVCSDHGQTHVDRHVRLEASFGDLDDVLVTASNRAGMVYRLGEGAPGARSLAERLDQEESAETVLFREGVDAIARREREELRFAPHAGAWTTSGDEGLLGYPGGLERAWAALNNPNAGDVIVSAAPGFEFADLAGRHHSGGGSHGSLRRGDSEVPMLTIGIDAQPQSIVEVAPAVLQHFGVAPPAYARTLTRAA